jgi:ribosomal protein S18 acetylase RimI-like enzyme
MNETRTEITIRNTRPEDFADIIEMTRQVYPDSIPWAETQLASHLNVFPEGQFVAVESGAGRVVGMAASLIILWDDYDLTASWRDFTDSGMFTNHDPSRGRTLYGAEVMVAPDAQGRGIGKKLYVARRDLVERLGLLRIRAGARLCGYHKYAPQVSAEDYVIKVVNGELGDPTLSFQLKQGFHVLAVVSGYLRRDPESLGYAAIIEWVNERVAKLEDYAGRNPRFAARGATA